MKDIICPHCKTKYAHNIDLVHNVKMGLVCDVCGEIFFVLIFVRPRGRRVIIDVKVYKN